MKNYSSKLKILIASLLMFLGFLGFAQISQAATIPAASCSQADVQAAINSASTGDTVVVPLGSCEWSLDVTIPDAKKITLKGAGVGSTVITNPGTTERLIVLGDSGSRLTGFTFNEIAVKLLMGNARIDHNKFYTNQSVGSGVHFSSASYPSYQASTALIDNNIFENCRVVVFGGIMMANTQWTLPVDIGGATNTVYVEDNIFNRTVNDAGNAVDANYGGAYVFRYNTVKGIDNYYNVMTHSVQGPNRATRKFEFYGNSIHTDYVTYNSPFFLRAGTGVVFGNYMSGQWRSRYIDLDNVRSLEPCCSGYPADVGVCNGESPWDGNLGEGTEAGYPCRDQIGRGYDTELWVRSPAGSYEQPLLPVYGWSNRSDIATEYTFRTRGESGRHIQANRDFYGYNASFNGTSGVGCGTLASRPTACTAGVGYWATNQSCSDLTGMVGKNPSTSIAGTLYKCTATNTWIAYYTPYTYPHPLRAEAAPPPDTTPPAAPTGVTIN